MGSSGNTVRFWAYDHIGKAAAYITALQKAGWQRVENIRKADLILLDIEHRERIEVLAYAERYDVPIVLYPHGAIPVPAAAQIPSRQVRVHFVPGPGHVGHAKRKGVPRRDIVISGFPYCAQRPFKPSAVPAVVVFAPLHPSANGFMCQPLRDANLAAQHRILELFPRASVHVSLFASLADNGLLPVGGWTYHRSQQKLDPAVALIDGADLVVAVETFAALGVARGKPTVTFAAPEVDWDGNPHPVADAIRYPYELTDGMEEALRVEASEWRRQIIGPDFQPGTVVKTCGRAATRRGAPVPA